MKNIINKLYLTFLLLLILIFTVNAQDGKLDESFAGGRIINSIGKSYGIGWNSEAHSVVIQSDGKIVAVGFSRIENRTVFTLVRYDINGSIDRTFGTKGVVTTNIGPSDNKAYSAAIQSDGKIIVAGYSAIGGAGSQRVFALVRYNTNGTLDNTFGTNGIATTAIGRSDDEARSLAIQGDGKIVAAGFSYKGLLSNGDTYVFALVRYNRNGSLDKSFGVNGIITTAVSSADAPRYDEALAVVIQANGKIVAAGHSGNGTHYNFALARYNTNGGLDNTFDRNGITTTAFSADAEASSVAIQRNGKIVAAGFSGNGTDYGFALARYNTNGSLDYTFGTKGKVITKVEQSSAAGSVVIQHDGRIIAAGYSGNGRRHYFALVRYNKNGSLDNTFGVNGITTTLFYADDKAYSAAIQNDGKIVAAGACEYNNFYNLNGFALIRYTGNSGEK